MTPPASDEPGAIARDEARQTYLGRGAGSTGMTIYVVIAIVVAMVGSAIAFEEVDNWSQWVILAAIIVTLIGVMIALDPNRRGN
ncbi:MAG: hypothetical protein M3O25_04440 [Actinomycetota bacterium]|nr:hypothetical protein [Actinomycetota bacterium]